MGLIAWIIIGVIVGGLAHWIVKGGFGLIGSMIGGIIGAAIGGAVTNAITADTGGIMSLNLVSIVFSVFFAILVVGFAKFALGRGSDA
jgi:uncharacterized membrane protein YeaQ/YmgE (transglycosylase-associated protein family)